MKTAIINNSFLSDGSKRIDPSFHLSESIRLKEKLALSSYQTTNVGKESEDIFFGNIFTRIFVKDANHGIPYVTASDMTKSTIDSGKFLSKKQAEKLSRLMLDKGWILISCSGTLGNVVYTNDLFESKIATHDLIRIIPNNKNILEGYLYAYLASKYGYILLTQSGFGGVVKHISPEHITNIPVPIFPESKQQAIHDLIVEASNLRVEANKLLEEAVNYFDLEYAPKDNIMTKVFAKNMQDLSFSWASYNNNKECDVIMDKIEDNCISIDSIADNIFVPPMFKHIYLNKDNGNPFLTGSELTQTNPRYYRWLSPRGVKNIQDYKVSTGTLLLYKSGTTDGGILGNVFIVDDNLNGACLSDHVIRIKIKDIKMAYWSYAFLKSKAGIRLLQRLATGTMIPFITPKRLKEIKLPIPNDFYDDITLKISSYLSKKTEANNKETQAIQMVENEIESWQKY
jgi:restriction endonuclease S subunit